MIIWDEVACAAAAELWRSFLCHIGLHRWKRVYRQHVHVFPLTRVRLSWEDATTLSFGWHRVGKKCQRCGRRSS